MPGHSWFATRVLRMNLWSATGSGTASGSYTSVNHFHLEIRTLFSMCQPGTGYSGDRHSLQTGYDDIYLCTVWQVNVRAQLDLSFLYNPFECCHTHGRVPLLSRRAALFGAPLPLYIPG